ncbi:MAG: PEP-CTERM sorting domain-containing protein [Bryobacteraceae bacterium]|nr:PEP-CTERM sorting domain-containing protein [Bryobacteraceae bacterium]
MATLACAAPLAQASTIYLYVGNDFQSADNRAGAWASTDQYITGWFMADAPLPASSLLYLTPAEWSLSDGLHTLDQSSDASSLALTILTDANGNFMDWSFLAGESGSGPDGTTGMTLSTTDFFGQMQDLSAGFFPGGASTALNANAPGTWSASTPIPEPGTVALSAAGGLLVLAIYRKRRRRI